MRGVGHLAHPVGRYDVEQTAVDPAESLHAQRAPRVGQPADVSNDLAPVAQGLAVDQYDAPGAQVRLNDVAGLEIQNAAAALGFGSDVADGGAVADAGVAPVGQDHRQLFQMSVGVDVLHRREHFWHSVGFRTLAADHHGEFDNAFAQQMVEKLFAQKGTEVRVRLLFRVDLVNPQ